jgi:hypothetical protein
MKDAVAQELTRVNDLLKDFSARFLKAMYSVSKVRVYLLLLAMKFVSYSFELDHHAFVPSWRILGCASKARKCQGLLEK